MDVSDFLVFVGIPVVGGTLIGLLPAAVVRILHWVRRPQDAGCRRDAVGLGDPIKNGLCWGHYDLLRNQSCTLVSMEVDARLREGFGTLVSPAESATDTCRRTVNEAVSNHMLGRHG